MNFLMSAFVVMAVLAGVAAPAHEVTTDSKGECPAGYGNVLGTYLTTN